MLTDHHRKYDTYFIPEDTSLTSQLIEFKKEKKRIGFVVDEYGDVKGVVTLDDILEEIVGDFTENDDKEILKIDEISYNNYQFIYKRTVIL